MKDNSTTVETVYKDTEQNASDSFKGIVRAKPNNKYELNQW